MRDFKGFSGAESDRWYKGNLHSHTTLSDGNWTPEQSVLAHREKGYGFLCLSDHEIFTNYQERYNDEKFILLPGVEYSIGLRERADSENHLKTHHLHGILGTKEMQAQASAGVFSHMQKLEYRSYVGEWDGLAVAQSMVDYLRAHGCFVTYNHPIWSRVEEHEFSTLHGVDLLEIYNYGTEIESATGYNITYWDNMIRHGHPICAFASDDNHNGPQLDDSFGGWVMVKAPELTQDAIVAGLLAGNFYSSAGPEIYDFGVREGVAYVDCSPVCRVNFVAGPYVSDGHTIMASSQTTNTLTHAEYTLRGREKTLRIECIDCYGRTAWTNALSL